MVLRVMRKGPLCALLFILFILAACKGPTMQEGAEWLREPDGEDILDARQADIPESNFYEVAASKVEIALMELEQVSISRLSPQIAVWYTGHYYACPPDKQPYLVRAVYGHAGTGVYNLIQIEDDLLIVHTSLGHSMAYHKSALVVNLDYEPDQVYIRVSIDE